MSYYSERCVRCDKLFDQDDLDDGYCKNCIKIIEGKYGDQKEEKGM